MQIIIKYSERGILWIDDPNSGVEPQRPKSKTALANIDTSPLREPLKLAESRGYARYGRSAQKHAQHIAEELCVIVPHLPPQWPAAEIEISESFREALQLATCRVTISDWIERYSEVGGEV